MNMMKKQETYGPQHRRAWFYTLALTIFVILTLLAGCTAKKIIPHTLIQEYETLNVRLIAILPAQDKTTNPEVNTLLRQRLFEALYYKGYPKVPMNVVDEKLSLFFKGTKTPDAKTVPPRDVGAILGVDAVLYTTLQECRTSFFMLYAPSAVKAKFSLYKTKTGELLWEAEYRFSESSWDITPGRLKMRAHQVYEPALSEIIGKAMETLPDGPDV